MSDMVGVREDPWFILKRIEPSRRRGSFPSTTFRFRRRAQRTRQRNCIWQMLPQRDSEANEAAKPFAYTSIDSS